MERADRQRITREKNEPRHSETLSCQADDYGFGVGVLLVTVTPVTQAWRIKQPQRSETTPC